MSDRARAQRSRLAGPALSRIWAAARRRIEVDPGGWTGASLSIPAPTDDERAEVEALVGRPFKGTRLAVRLADLDEALRAGPIGFTLPEWLERIGGQLRDRPAERMAREGRLAAALHVLRGGTHRGEGWYDAWVSSLDASGLLARYDTDGHLDSVRHAVSVLDRIPGPPVPRQQLAADVAGDPKALEDGPIARLVLGALAARVGAAPPSDAEETRALWEHFDVLTDDLASQVIVLGLRPTGPDPLSSWLRAAADAGHPVVLTRRDVARPLSFAAGDVFACENPTIVHAAASRLGAFCQPLVCANGRPHAAFWVLAERLRATGARLHYHGDFDPVGLDIAGSVIRRLGAEPWRMGTADYLEALTRVEAPSWRGQVAIRTAWDPALAVAMAESGRAVFEEHVLDTILSDLRKRSIP